MVARRLGMSTPTPKSTRVLLDTQTLILAATAPRLLPSKIRSLVGNVDVERVVSAVTVTELAIKSSIGKLPFSAALFSEAAVDLQLTVVPFTPAQAARLFALPMHHREPFDRMLIAVAIHEGIALVGGDTAFPLYRPEGLRVIWK